MAKDQKIVVNETTTLTTSQKVDGFSHLDLGDFRFRLNKSVEKLTSLDTIEGEGMGGGSLPFSAVNDAILERFHNANAEGSPATDLDCDFFDGGFRHNFNRLRVTGVNDSSKTYEVQPRLSTEHWLRQISDLLLKDIGLPDFDFTEANVLTTWTTHQGSYTDGNVGYSFPIVNYGRFLDNVNSLYVEDLRPLFSPLYIFQQGFCKAGWDFRSPILEGSYGRRLWMYLLRENYASDEDLLESRKFNRHVPVNIVGDSITVPTDANNKLDFPTVVLNNASDNFDTDQFFVAAGEYEFFVSGPLSHNNTTTSEWTATIGLYKLDINGNDISLNAEQTFTLQAGQFNTFAVDLKTERVSVIPGERVYVKLTATSTIIQGFTNSVTRVGWRNTPYKTYYLKGSTIPISEEINQDYTVLDVLKGIAGLFNARFTTDWATKTVTMYTPFDAVFSGETIEGFYTSTIDVFSDDIVADSKRISIGDQFSRPRFVKLKFANSSDQYIEDLGLDEDSPLFSKTIDYGTAFDNGTREITNSFFEPTANAEINNIPSDDFNGLDVPHMIDNDDDELSYQIGPRILYCKGYVTQRINSTDRTYKFENTSYSSVLYNFQLPNSNYNNGGTDELPAERLIYGEDNAEDLFTKCWAVDLIEQRYGFRTGYTIKMTLNNYLAESFRNMKSIYYNNDGQQVIYRLLEINNFDNADRSAEIVLRPVQVLTSDTCATIVTNTCSNTPKITLAFDNSIPLVVATADNTSITSTIDTDTWEYSTDNGSTWTSYTPGGTVVGQSPVIFRRNTTYQLETDGSQCPPTSVTSTYSQSCSNSAGIDFSYNDTTNSLTANASASDSIAFVNTDTWTVSLDNAAAITYTVGTPVSGFTTATFVRTVTFTNQCPDITVTETYTATTNAGCDNSGYSIQATEVSDCIYTFAIAGTGSTIFMTEFFIDSTNSGKYIAWDGKPVFFETGGKVRAILCFSDTCSNVKLELTCPF